MQIMDFTKMMEKYSLLEGRDVSFLNKFFNEEKQQKLLDELEIIRKKKRKYWTIIFILWLLMISVFCFFSDVTLKNISSVFYISCISLIAFIVIWGLISIFIFKNKSIKKDLLPGFVSQIDKNIKYSEKDIYFDTTLSDLKSIGLLKKYTRVDKKEDSIEYNIWNQHISLWDNEIEKVEKWTENILITWCEIKTSEKRVSHTKDWKRKTRYVKTNHCYMMKIDFKNAKFNLEKSIRLSDDVNDNTVKKVINVAIIESIILWIWYTIFTPFLDYILYNFLIISSIIIWLYAIIWLIYNQIINKKRVKLENDEFEKKFDVYSEDQIESRRLLTSSFMYRLVDYVNKIDEKRVYEMYFHKNIFYIKLNFMKSKWLNNYLEVSSWKNVYKNLEDYVEFYLELKNITSLVTDLKLFYYDKWIMNTKVIK